jgi:hypothetical protein
MRHSRQMRLAGVGEVGQRRIACAHLALLADGFAGDIATRYLTGAGVGHLSLKDSLLAASARAVDPTVQISVDPSLPVGPTRSGFPLQQRGAIELAIGAHLALELLRQTLEGST